MKRWMRWEGRKRVTMRRIGLRVTRAKNRDGNDESSSGES